MFRFTIRDVLWLMMVVGLALGWGMDRWLTTNDRTTWRSRAYYWAGAANAAKDSLNDAGHTVDFIEGVGVEIDKRLILVGGPPNSETPQ